MQAHALDIPSGRSSLSASAETRGFVTMRIARQLIGVPVIMVHDVLRRMEVTGVPLASPEIAGLMNLRGRIVTVIDVRTRLGLPQHSEPGSEMHAVVEYKGESFSLMVDAIGEVVNLAISDIEKPPANLEGKWKEVAASVCRMKEELLVILDVQSLLTF